MKFILVTLVSLLSVAAMAQRTYEADGFYINVESRNAVAIGVTDGSVQFFTDDDDREMDVEVYRASDLREGYEIAAEEIAGPDFVVNIKGSEMCTIKVKDAARFVRAMGRTRGGAVLRMDVVDGSQPKGMRKVFWRIPKEGVQAVVEAYDKFPLW